MQMKKYRPLMLYFPTIHYFIFFGKKDDEQKKEYHASCHGRNKKRAPLTLSLKKCSKATAITFNVCRHFINYVFAHTPHAYIKITYINGLSEHFIHMNL